MSVKPNADTNIAIIGAGVGGCIAALALAPHYSVTLIDKQVDLPPRVGECLPSATLRILRALKLEHLLDEEHHLKSQGMLSYWGSQQPTIADNLSNPDGFGWHIDRPLFEQQLRQAAQERGVTCLWPSHLITHTKMAKHWELTLQQGSEISSLNADVVIDATGRHCVFTRQLGVARQQFDKLMSIWLTANVHVNKKFGLISSTDKSWWYSAPIPTLPTNHAPESKSSSAQARVVSWQAESAIIDKTLSKSPQAFLAAACKAPGFKPLIDRIDLSSVKLQGIVAANSSKLTTCSGQQWFAIGDAAMSFDPISSQGMFNAMASAMQLSELLISNRLHHMANQQLYQQQMDSVWQQYLAHKALFYKMMN
ncbi:NAD(P)/FAD-dependent oxidoreductase [Photobacterium minamisatsumaniensis]|uniref:NAD(P)/FAD-dependent oxidoreductase n=1 Tax=Photobacterium minamisatsumaniensis TaxID=2910233 RepID=UPI003D0F14B3